MIFFKLISHHLKNKDDLEFYSIQANDAISWLLSQGVNLDSETSAVDLGCGEGIIGARLIEAGCKVTFADIENCLAPGLEKEQCRIIDIENDDISGLGTFDVVIFSNVLEHLTNPYRLLMDIDSIMKPGGYLFMSWTNWLSPWGGHEFSPFHYLGPGRGHLVYDRLVGKPRKHTPYENLTPVSIGKSLKTLNRNTRIEVLDVVPRYYPKLSFITRIPIAREFLTWNCAVLARKY